MQEIEKAITQLSMLPGIGRKSAYRILHKMLLEPDKIGKALVSSLEEMMQVVHRCPICGNFATDEFCSICNNSKRRREQICVVQEPIDIEGFEGMGLFSGVYHVLGGLISPMDGIDPDAINLRQLRVRIDTLIKEGLQVEIVLAFVPSVEADVTSSYIRDYLSKYTEDNLISITELATGLSAGLGIDFADKMTLKRAFEGRK